LDGAEPFPEHVLKKEPRTMSQTQTPTIPGKVFQDGLAVPVAGRGHPGARPPIPERFCNTERLLWMMEQRGLDGIVVSVRPNVYYMSGYASRASQAQHESGGYGAFFLSAAEPEHPILAIPDFELTYVAAHPSWVKDFRVYPVMSLPYHLPVDDAAFARSVPPRLLHLDWVENARRTYTENFQEACSAAMAALRLDRGRIGFDEPRFAQGLVGDGVEVIDAYSMLLGVRQVKTAAEIEMLRLGARINEGAILELVSSWQPGMTWLDLNHLYHVNVIKRGGFVTDPGGVIVNNPQGIEAVFEMDAGTDDFEIVPGMNIMLDCHGMVNLYRWDSGKTWVVESERTGTGALIERAAIEAMEAVKAAIVPGVELRALQEVGLDVFRRLGVPDWERTSIFFHGLGLSHSDVEVLTKAGRPDWKMEDGQIVSTHVVYPGSLEERFYLEDNAIARPAGGESLYDWDFETLLND
jgi:Xaa-Pro aminopeptidase